MSAVLEARQLGSRTELDLLQGAWVSIAGRREVRLLFAGERFSFEFVEGDVYMGTLFLDGEMTPKQIDLLIEEGPKDKGKIALCIYQLDGDIMRFCPTQPGTDRRLRQFPSVEDERYLSLVFKKQRRRTGR